jgi:hypothetical protein
MREVDQFSPASHVWCDVCKRNGRVHTHKCKECDHEEDGNHWNIHRDGYCMQCHPTLGFKALRAELRSGRPRFAPAGRYL